MHGVHLSRRSPFRSLEYDRDESRIVMLAAGLMLSLMTTLSPAEDTKLTIMAFRGDQNLPLSST
jgi:hypothetical protein